MSWDKWDKKKELENIEKHLVDFEDAKKAFSDPDRVILEDIEHSDQEKRYLCIGKVAKRILTVRFTYRDGKVRIFGAGYWRKQRRIYDEQRKKRKS